MKPMLDRYGVSVVALSKDPPELARAHRDRDGIEFTLLSDPDLAVIERFGLLHEEALEFTTFFVAGIPLGWPKRLGFDRMAIPTTLLIDEQGIVRWIDQADDYRLRGDERRTLAALEESFGEPGPTSGDSGVGG